MAGRVKHAQRSHYSYHNHAAYGHFADCMGHAASREMFKEQSMTIGARVRQFFRNFMKKGD